jgi:predicted RNase H-like HicB family nuclease
MPVRYYPAILERTSSGLHASFPDFPGCTAFGETFEDAAASAESGLALHLAGMVEDGDSIPQPSPLDGPPVDPEAPEAGRLLVRVELPGRVVRVNITMDEGLLAAVDAAARQRETSRSGFLATAARRALTEEPRPAGG